MSIFDNVAFSRAKRNVFNLSHEVRTTAAFGKLLPVFCEEVLPGDTFQVSTSAFVRAMPMLAPLMHRVNIYTHFFFVPNRLVWDNWEDFITGGPDGTANPVFPRIQLIGAKLEPGSLADHLGVGTFLTSSYENSSTTDKQKLSGGVIVNALPFRAYNLIWNEYYRDQNLQDEIEFSKDDGVDAITPTTILNRNWEKDYFTSALPWTQRGPQSSLPVQGNVVLDDVTKNPIVVLPDGTPLTQFSVLGTMDSNYSAASEPGGLVANMDDGTALPTSSNIPIAIDPNGSLQTDAIVQINELRRAIALQKWLEANARGGARYIEQIFAHFGVQSSDARLQRPEYLGGGMQPLSISEVLQTSASTTDSNLGDMAGHGISAAQTRQFRRNFEEHGFVIGIMSIMPKTSYSMGTARVFRKFDKFDYAFPEFANLGEQEVYNSEIYQLGNTYFYQKNDGVFGYQSRYAEYKYKPNTIHGHLREDAFSPWTLVRTFAVTPNLNSYFIESDWENEDLGRIFPITDSDTQFVVQLYHDFKAIRKLPKFVIPEI